MSKSYLKPNERQLHVNWLLGLFKCFYKKKKQLNVNKRIENREKRKIVNEGGNGDQTFREVHRNKLIASIWVVLVGDNMTVIYFTCFHIPTTSIKCPLEKLFSQKGRYE